MVTALSSSRYWDWVYILWLFYLIFGCLNCVLFLYSKIKTNYIIEPFIENSNFENRKLIVKMRISDHVLEIEIGRYNKINREQRICRQYHINVTEDEEHFFFHCQKQKQKKTNY